MNTEAEDLASRLRIVEALERWNEVTKGVNAVSKFTIEVADDVSVAPLAKMLAANGYKLKTQSGTDRMELTETEQRKADIVAAARRRQELQEMRATL